MTDNQWTEDPAYTRPPDPLNPTPVTGTPGATPGTTDTTRVAGTGYGTTDLGATPGTSTGTGTGTDGSSTKEAVKGEASDVARTAKESAAHVAETAKSEASTVAAEAKTNAKELLYQARDDLTQQAGQQQQMVASGLRSISDELQTMASASDQPGMATDLVRQAADRSASVAQWLEGRDPGSLLDEVKSFARQRPGTFLLLAAGAGVLAGRLGRGLTGDSGSSSDDRTRSTAYGAGAPVRPADGGAVPPPAVDLPGPTATTASYYGGASTTDPYAGPDTTTDPYTGTGTGAGTGTGTGTGTPLSDDPESWPETGGPR
ncbi:hypothetical protein V1639_16050 [Pseudarthrobacter sp. J75]|uniref:hypothetical protein n=1 Tax=unclassified Pseudarthrobacter TaxID=2647000 RepID=UPI002E810B42|nr:MULTISPECIES: hypothetical protein [unclassified Pseudarthrobacter]MEE2523548.1 hypothetical protein [Pseudarthrobacter sp. J47]MEE2530530.1 hypothetical protein [Pseudarthrobacter sp. J75]